MYNLQVGTWDSVSLSPDTQEDNEPWPPYPEGC